MNENVLFKMKGCTFTLLCPRVLPAAVSKPRTSRHGDFLPCTPVAPPGYPHELV